MENMFFGVPDKQHVLYGRRASDCWGVSSLPFTSVCIELLVAVCTSSFNRCDENMREGGPSFRLVEPAKARTLSICHAYEYIRLEV